MPPKKAHRAEKLMNKLLFHEEDDDENEEDEEEEEEADDEQGYGDQDEEVEEEDEGEEEHDDRDVSEADLVPVYPQPGQRPHGPGKMPPKVKSLKYRGNLKFFHPSGHEHGVLCDLGFTGIINERIVWSFGDTHMKPRHGKSYICAQDSIAIGSMKRPMTATNTALGENNKNVRNWIPCNDEENKQGGHTCFGFGGTNIIEYAPNKGLVYYLKIKRAGAKPKGVKGAGVATVNMTKHDIPRAHRNGDIMWDKTEPKWGDVGIAYNSQDGHVYVYGHGPNCDKEISGRVFLCKAPADKATDIDSYLYYDAQHDKWLKQRLTRNGAPGTVKIRKNMAVFPWRAVNQANPFWSNYFNKWMIIHGDCFGFSAIQVSTANRLEGPWHGHGVVARTEPPKPKVQKGFRYCQTGHPEFDSSGKTVLATWTRGNRIWGVWIEWE